MTGAALEGAIYFSYLFFFHIQTQTHSGFLVDSLLGEDHKYPAEDIHLDSLVDEVQNSLTENDMHAGIHDPWWDDFHYSLVGIYDPQVDNPSGQPQDADNLSLEAESNYSHGDQLDDCKVFTI